MKTPRLERDATARLTVAAKRPIAVAQLCQNHQHRAIAVEYAAAKSAVEKLTTLPDDAEANTVVGRYRALVEGDWPNALPLLAKGNEELWKELATKSLAAAADGPSRAAVGDAWWDAAQAKATQKSELTAGALYWYQAALPSLTGLQRTRIEKRIADAATAVPQRKIPATPLASAAITMSAAPVTFTPPATPSVAAPFAPLPSSATPDRRAVEWILNLGAFATVRTIDGKSVGIVKEGIPVGPFELNHINLRGVKAVTDEALINLSGLKGLKIIDLAATPITGTGLRHLAASAETLTNLNLDSCPITDEGAASFALFKNLQSLPMRNTKLTDRGLAAVSQLKQLGGIGLEGTAITDAGVQHLAGLPNLTNLTLRGTQITDASLSILVRMTQLTQLDLAGNVLSDAGIAQLATLRSLKSLNLDGSRIQVSDATLAKLKQALPNCKITR